MLLGKHLAGKNTCMAMPCLYSILWQDYMKFLDRELKPEQIFYGTQLQLLLYLSAALGMYGGAEPAGAYYMFFRDPMVREVSPEDLKAVEAALAKKLHLSGISLKDVHVLELMDSAVPPVTMDRMVTKDGTPNERKPLADLEEMRLLIGHARETARRICVSMQGGHIRPEPLQAGRDSPCALCDYRGICRQENSRARKRAAMTVGELFDRLREIRDSRPFAGEGPRTPG